MTTRTVSVRLQALIGPYSAALAKATRDTKEFKQTVGQAARDGDKDFKQLGTGALIAGGAVALGFGKMVGTAAGFQKQMSAVQAVSGASADEMARLSDAAIAAGKSTQLAGVTASDAAAAQAELVKAGVSTADILGGGLMGSLQLATAGQIEFADAATIAAQAMNIFDLGGSQVTRVADVLAAAANKSAADVKQLGDGLRQGGLVAAQTGLSLEETAGALAAFADNALVGSDAGTSLKTMLQRLTPQSDEAAELMDQLGFSAYDAAGEFIGLEGLAGELKTALSGMTTEQRNAAMATLFGSDAVRAANILYSEGATGIGEYVDAVNDQGAAARMAAIQNDNLQGDVEALGGALEAAFIENGSKATGALRELTQAGTAAVNGFSAMPGAVQTSAMALAGVAGAGTLALGAMGTLAPKLAEGRKALDKMGASGKYLNSRLGTMGKSLGVLGAGFAAFAIYETIMADARAEADKWADIWRGSAMSSAADGLDAFKDKLSDVRREQEGLLSSRDDSILGRNWYNSDLNESLEQGSDNLGVIGDEMERVASLADDLAGQFNMTGDAALRFVLDQQSAGIDVLADDYEAVATAMGKAWTTGRTGTAASQEMAASMSVLGDEVATVEEQVDAFRKAIDALFSSMYGTEAAADALQSQVNELPELLAQAAEDGLNLNDALTSQSDAAITLRGHMRDMTSSATDLIAEWREQGVTGRELEGRIGMLSQSFRDQAEAAGVPGPVVDHYLDLLGRIPTDKSTDINVRLNGYQQVIAQLDAISRRNGTSVLINASVRAREQAALGNRWGNVHAYAAGGISQAHVATRQIHKYAEPETGGEAYIPRLGSPSRSLGILQTAAGWYGQTMVPATAGAGRGATAASAGGASPVVVVETPVYLDGRKIGSSRAVYDGIVARNRDAGRLTAGIGGM